MSVPVSHGARDPKVERPAAGPSPAAAAPVLVRLADVVPEPVRWLWPGRLPRGKLSLLIGDPGAGKSFVLADCAARVSTGEAWPASQDRAERCAVVLLAAEDGLADTLRPRLAAHGADLDHVHSLEAVKRTAGEAIPFSLARDVPTLERAIHETGAGLVLLDPLSAYFGAQRDSYKDTEVRAVLGPLVQLASRTGVAVVGVVHLSKAEDRRALHRALGSVGFVAVARSILAVGPDPADPDRRLLVSVKSSLAPRPPALAFRISGDPARVVWEPVPAGDIDPETVLGSGRDRGNETVDARARAEAFLAEMLADVERPAVEVLEAGRAQGLSGRTIQRAKQSLGVRVRHSGQPGRPGAWFWSLPVPVPVAPVPKKARPEELATLGKPAAGTHESSRASPKAATRPAPGHLGGTFESDEEEEEWA